MHCVRLSPLLLRLLLFSFSLCSFWITATHAQSFPEDTGAYAMDNSAFDAGRSPISFGLSIQSQYQTTDGHQTIVLDHALQTKNLREAYQFQKPNFDRVKWSYQEDESLARNPPGGNVGWTGQISPALFERSDLGQEMKTFVRGTFGDGLRPYEAKLLVLQRGEETRVFSGERSPTGSAEEVVTLTWFLEEDEKWNTDSYGEVLFFDGDEIMAAVQPRYSRLVMWHSKVPVLIHPPSIRYEKVRRR